MKYLSSGIQCSIVVAATLVVLAGCDEPLGPIRTIQPEVAEMRIGFVGSGSNTLMAVTATIADGNGSFGNRDRLEVTIRAGEGNTNQMLLLQPEWCGPVESPYRCDKVNVVLNPEADIERVYDRAHRLPGRFIMGSIRSGDGGPVIHTSSTLGAIYLLDGSVETARRVVARWPEIRIAELSGPGFIAGGPPLTPELRSGGYLPLSEDGDQGGFAMTGGSDEINVEYRQPGGAILRTTASLPN